MMKALSRNLAVGKGSALISRAVRAVAGEDFNPLTFKHLLVNRKSMLRSVRRDDKHGAPGVRALLSNASLRLRNPQVAKAFTI
jgi:hypothetical protein